MSIVYIIKNLGISQKNEWKRPTNKELIPKMNLRD